MAAGSAQALNGGVRALLIALACAIPVVVLATEGGDERVAAPSLAGFGDAIHHWRNVHGDK